MRLGWILGVALAACGSGSNGSAPPADAGPNDEGGVATNVVTLATFEGNLAALAVAGDTVYAATLTGTDRGRILAVPAAGGPLTVLASDGALSPSSRIAVDDTHVYWSDFYKNRIRRVRRDGGAAEVVTETGIASVRPSALAIDATDVYWGAEGSTELYRAPKAGGPFTTVGTGIGEPVGIAIDETFVFVAGKTGLVRLPKTGGASADRVLSRSRSMAPTSTTRRADRATWAACSGAIPS
jgi:hypothetical protein